jgi:predicted metalloprotease
MNPQQPVAPLPPNMPASGQPHLPHNPGSPTDPYRFIMEPPKVTKPKVPGIGGNPFLMKIVFVLGGAVVVMIVIAVVVSIFFGSKTNIQDIQDIAATEQELIRVSNKGGDATDQSVKNAAVTTQATIITEQQEWLTFLSKHGHKADPKKLILKKNTATDTRLTQAQATSTFDLTFTQIMRTQLQAHSTELKNAYAGATNKEEKTLLEKDFKAVNLLLEQWPSNTTPPVNP